MKISNKSKRTAEEELHRARLNIHVTHNYLKSHILDCIKPIN